ncbi:MAG: hypothetical protein Q8Q60_00015 [Candidatus Chromulinivorax sp.]|nr:hypothetical protein [Candidatus Chromulinivorax sp.]
MVKKSIKKLFVGLAAFSAVSMCASADVLTQSHNFFQPRAFSANLAREMMMEGSKHKDSDKWYGEFSAAAAYQRSWNQGMETSEDVDLADGVNGLGVYPFWSGTNVMTVGTNLSGSDLDAYQFGLGSVTSNGSITLSPVVYQAGADFMFVFGSSANQPCFFAKIKAPVGVYNINPNLVEVDATPAVYAIGALQSATATTTLADPASTMTQAFAGNLPGGQTAVGDFQIMQYGLLDGAQSIGKFGDIEMTAGYRFISNDDNSFSVAVRAAAPTGGSADGIYMLEPIFGRGGNWALGGYLDGHVKLWEGNNDNSFQVKFMGNAQHLFDADTVRSYDLVSAGAGSKYLLVATYSSTNVYGNAIANLINYSTLASKSSFAVEGDAVLSFAYVGRGWSLDLGYEFWGRSAEALVITGAFSNQSYAILGRQGISDAAGTSNVNLCQPTATIAASLARVDAAAGDVVDATAASNRVAFTDLDVAAAEQNASLSSKVFSKIAYEWMDSNYRPHVGVMGEFEISNSNNNALPQWSVSLVGGVSF